MKDGVMKEEKLFNYRPVFFLALSLCLGIFFCFHCRFNGVSIGWALCLLPILGTSFFFCRGKKRGIAILSLLLSFVLGFFLFSFQVDDYQEMQEKGGAASAYGRVVEKRLYEDSTGFVLDSIDLDGERVNAKLVAYLPCSFYETVEYGDVLYLEGNIYYQSVNIDTFHLQANAFGDKICFGITTSRAVVVDHEFDLFLSLRARVEKVIEAGMDETPAAVTKAVLFGNVTEIDDGLYENVKWGGVAHIFAVSGLHVGALFGFVLLLTKRTGLRKTPKVFRFLLLGSILFVYAGVCGFSASVLRASIICLVTYAASLLTIKSDFLESLGLSAVLILLSKPSSLFEIGFQLSFFACLGLTFLSKPIGQVFDKGYKVWQKAFPRKLTQAQLEMLKDGDTLPPSIGERVYRWTRDFLSASLGAQVFTAPLLLQYYGYVSGWALLLNCLFVPLVSIAFSGLLLLTLFASLFPIEFALLILYLPNLVWSALLLVFQIFNFSSFLISGFKISVAASLCYYAGCVFCTDKWNLKRAYSNWISLLCFLAFVITMVGLNI